MLTKEKNVQNNVEGGEDGAEAVMGRPGVTDTALKPHRKKVGPQSFSEKENKQKKAKGKKTQS